MSVLEWIIDKFTGKHEEICCCPECKHDNKVTYTRNKRPDHYWCCNCNARVNFTTNDGLGNIRGARR